jgi:phosphatidylglycerophosphate synthase
MSTDWLDGQVARRRGHASSFGSLLDPVADKLLVLTMLIMLVGERVFLISAS